MRHSRGLPSRGIPPWKTCFIVCRCLSCRGDQFPENRAACSQKSAKDKSGPESLETARDYRIMNRLVIGNPSGLDIRPNHRSGDRHLFGTPKPMPPSKVRSLAHRGIHKPHRTRSPQSPLDQQKAFRANSFLLVFVCHVGLLFCLSANSTSSAQPSPLRHLLPPLQPPPPASPIGFNNTLAPARARSRQLCSTEPAPITWKNANRVL